MMEMTCVLMLLGLVLAGTLMASPLPLNSDMAIIMNPVMVPDMEMLVMMRNSDYAMAMAMENEELGLTEVKPPPMRVKEKHGNAKRNRKRKGKYIMRMFTFNVLYMFKIILLLHVEDKEYNPCG
jgi:hypothetical protein